MTNNLSFDPAHRWFEVPGLQPTAWAIEVFTNANVYGLDPAACLVEGNRVVASGFQALGGQRRFEGSAAIEVVSDGGLVSWVISAQCHEPIKAVKLLLQNLPTHLTARGWWAAVTPSSRTLRATPDRPLLLTYPWSRGGDSWETPWVCAGEGPALGLSVRDPQVREKRFYAYQPHWAEGEIVEIICTAAAADRGPSFKSPEIRLRLCSDAGAVHRDFAEHLSWLEDAYGLTPWAERRDAPKWADSLDLVLTLHGQHWTGFVFNTFEQMASILEEICAEVPGHRVLAYLPGWEGRYYWQYPEYRPAPDLGGDTGFGRLCDVARRLGVHLMPMFGANGANVNRYPNWKQAAFRSPSNRYVELINRPDWDNDRSGEDDQVFLNPGEPTFQQHLAEQIIATVDRYGVEGVFLDTTACWFDDPRHDVYGGYQALITRIRADRPGLLICGEGWYDALLTVFPMNQTWVDMTVPPRFDDLPMRYSRLLGHLKDGAPGAGSTGVHEGGTSTNSKPLHRNGFVPSLAVVDDTFTKHRADVLAFCRALAGRAR